MGDLVKDLNMAYGRVDAMRIAPPSGPVSSRAAADEIQSALDGLKMQLERANRIIGWMMPYIGSMCPPDSGLHDLNLHCCENVVPEPGRETKGRPINQRLPK